MRKHWRAWLILAITMGASLAPAAARADQIDFTRADGGDLGRLCNVVPSVDIPWYLFDQPWTSSLGGGGPQWFGEPGQSNNVDITLGQVLFTAPVGQYGARVVMDMLAWVPTPHLFLVEAPGMDTSGFAGAGDNAGYQGVYLGGGGDVGSGTSGQAAPFVLVIPEPATLSLLALGAWLLLPHRERSHR